MNIFPNSISPLSMAIAQHYEVRELAIEHLIALYKEGYDIEDPVLFNAALRRYGLLEDGFNSETEYIITEVARRIK